MLTDYSARWALIGVCALVAMGWLFALHIPVDFGSVLPKVEFLGVPLCFSAVYSGIGNRIPRFGRPFALATDCCLSMVQVLAVMAVLLPLTYLAATTGHPLVDDKLVRLDAMLGFNWDSAAQWVGARPAVDWLFLHAYRSALYEGIAILVIGSFALDRNGELIWIFTVSGLITCAIFAFTPAAGKIGHLGPGYLNLLMEIRSGQWSVMTYTQNEGIVTFPSFHATLAIIMTYAVRRQRWALAVFAPLNCIMMLAIPTVGGHYLVDLFGGAAVAGLAIFLVGLIRRPLCVANPSPAYRQPVRR